jgi:hypothetical protein
MSNPAAQGFNPEPCFPYEPADGRVSGIQLDVGAVVATAIATTEVGVVGRIVVGG